MLLIHVSFVTLVGKLVDQNKSVFAQVTYIHSHNPIVNVAPNVIYKCVEQKCQHLPFYWEIPKLLGGSFSYLYLYAAIINMTDLHKSHSK